MTMTPTFTTTVESLAEKNATEVGENTAPPAVALAPRVQMVADLLGEARARRFRQPEASTSKRGREQT